MSLYQHIEVEQRGAVRWLWLNRPEVRNAFNDALVSDISAAFADVEAAAGYARRGRRRARPGVLRRRGSQLDAFHGRASVTPTITPMR